MRTGTLARYYAVPGRAYQGWGPSLPRIIDDVLKCVIYLYRSQHEAEEAINIGGSGFLVSVPAERIPAPAGFTYVVTNGHVIEKKANILRVNTRDGKFKTFPTNNWLVSESRRPSGMCDP